MADQDVARTLFAEYYTKHHLEIKPPSAMDQREFGFLLSREKMMVRHKSFTTQRELHEFLQEYVPGDVYYSSAYYTHPTMPMEKKGWLGADLIFDIDSDHLDTPCKQEHDYWTCDNCSRSGRGDKPGTCANCGGAKFRTETWPCEKCLDAAKMETQKLLDFLISDFGFPPEETVICFSGQRGYHVHIEEPEVRQLDQGARREISDYITGLGLKLEFHGLADTDRNSGPGPEPDSYGWDGRIAKGVFDALSAVSSPKEFKKIDGVSAKAAKVLTENRDKILESWGTTKSRPMRSVDMGSWRALASQEILKQSSIIDTVVTTDIHRLIRLPLTLHGKTGLKAVLLLPRALDRFDPLEDAVAFNEGVLRVSIDDCHAFRIGDQTFGPYTNEEAELPLAAALFLLCKRVAKPVLDQDLLND
ncbi:DNA primase small subunit PriS [Candidatus Bathyarchaeota archaeon]|nr:DNA primase small subunit PriS [Candidatus Bathyarchaeota archaeon]